MAVEKMSLISVSGPLKKVNKTLVRCCETKCFHIEPSFYTMTYGSAHFKFFRTEQNTRKGNCYKASKESGFRCNCLCRTGRSYYRSNSDRYVCRCFSGTCMDSNRRSFKLCYGITDLSLVKERNLLRG